VPDLRYPPITRQTC